MDIYSSSDLSILFKSVSTTWQKAFLEYPTIWKQIATRQPMATRQMVNAFMDRTPMMRKWIGNRVINSASVLSRVITSEPYESTIGLNMFDLADDLYGVLGNTTQQLAVAAAQWPDKLIADMIKGLSVTVGYDGVPVYATNHPLLNGNAGGIPAGAPATQSNLFLNTPLTFDNFASVRATMRSWRGSNGGLMNILPSVLMVPPALESLGKQILEGDFLANIDGITTAPQSNVYKNSAKLLVNPWLADYPNNWWLLAPMGAGMNPYVFWERLAPVFTYAVQPTDANVLQSGTFIYGSHSHGTASESVWFLSAAATSEAQYTP
jgi:phage major head subunit gpT-like protein